MSTKNFSETNSLTILFFNSWYFWVSLSETCIINYLFFLAKRQDLTEKLFRFENITPHGRLLVAMSSSFIYVYIIMIHISTNIFKDKF
jgi:hypothetical protein